MAITFDDGYADNLTAAKPLLKKYGFPATFFLATGALGKPREFWWDELEARLLSPGLLPHCLELSVNGITRKWDLGAETCYSSDAWEHHRHWRARNPPTTVRQRVYYELWEWLRQLPPNSQERILDQLADWSGSTRGARSTHRPLSLEEAGILGSHPHFDLGAHTVNHVVLPAHPASVQQEEIRASKSVTESIAKRPVVCFAYPYGDHSPETVEIVRRTGFASAVTTRAVCLNRHSNPWQLPRFNITDSDGAEFAHRLSRSCQPK